MDPCYIILSNNCRMQSFAIHLFAARKSTFCDYLFASAIFFLFFWCVLLKKAFGHCYFFYLLRESTFCFFIISKISSIDVYHLLHASCTWWKRLGHILVPIQPVSTFVFLGSIVQVLDSSVYLLFMACILAKGKREITNFFIQIAYKNGKF
jgi:hypothetical protein